MRTTLGLPPYATAAAVQAPCTARHRASFDGNIYSHPRAQAFRCCAWPCCLPACLPVQHARV